MADAYKVQALAGTKLSAWALLHAATRGAAQALGLGHEIGSLEGGTMRRPVRVGLGRQPGGAAPPAGGARLA